jgi:hypothetical protein
MERQFFIGGLGFFIRAKNLSELVRRISADLLGFPEIPSVLTPKRWKNSPLTLWRNAKTILAVKHPQTVSPIPIDNPHPVLNCH